MSTLSARIYSDTNSFYESEGRPSFDQMSIAANPTNKSRELERAIRKERDGLVPSFRPPSNWSQRTGQHDVIWNGDSGRDSLAHEDQFSDAESWDGETQLDSYAATNGDLGVTASVYEQIKPSNSGTPISATVRARPDRSRREAPPPLFNSSSASSPSTNGKIAPQSFKHLSPYAGNMASPNPDVREYESERQSNARDAKDDASDVFHLAVSDSTASLASTAKFPLEADTSNTGTLVPSRGSSIVPPIPAKAASRHSNESRNKSRTAFDGEVDGDECRADSSFSSLTSGAGDDADSSFNRKRLADGTVIPKMPPVPATSDLSRPRKTKGRRNRSPVLSFDGAAAEEELKLSEMQGELANDPRRISTLGPKVKRNAPAPWELGGEEDDLQSSTGRSSLRDTFRPSNEGFEKPFSRFKTRPSTESTQGNSGRTSNQASTGMPMGLDHEAQKEDDSHSIFASQRSRSKSVSNTAVGMLKGLGLAAAAAPASASRKAKLSKALRLVGGGSEERKGPGHGAGPLSELPSATNIEFNAPPMPAFARKAGEMGSFPRSASSRTIQASGNALPSKSQADLAEMLMSSNTKYKDQACSPPLPSPTHGRITSPRIGGARSLGYKNTSVLSNSNSSEDGGSVKQSSSKDSGVSRMTHPLLEKDERSSSESGEKGTASSAIVPTVPSDGLQRASDSTPLAKAPSNHEAAGAIRIQACAPSDQSTGSNGAMSTSLSQSSGTLPLPGNIEGVQYKLISLEQAREQARLKQNDWLTTSVSGGDSMRLSPSQVSLNTSSDEVNTLPVAPWNEASAATKTLKNKKSGFLRKLKKDKVGPGSIDFDGVSTFGSNGSSKDLLRRGGKAPMPSFFVTGLDGEDDSSQSGLAQTPALSLRPVSSMFSGFAPDFLDASAIAEGHLRDSSNGSTASSSGLLVPHSPVGSTFRSPDMSRSSSTFDGGRFPSNEVVTSPLASSSSSRPKVANIKLTSHDAHIPGPRVPDSADSTRSLGRPSTTTTSRLPSLDAGGSTSDGHSHFHSPVNSPVTPSFQQPLHPATSASPSISLSGGAVEELTSPPASPYMISEEVRLRARDLEAQIKDLSQELQQLRVQHVGQGTAPTFVAIKTGVDAEGDEESAVQQIGSCFYCGCGCAEQRRLQSINEAAVLKGMSILDRGRALKSSNNMGNSGKFGGYTNR